MWETCNRDSCVGQWSCRVSDSLSRDCNIVKSFNFVYIFPTCQQRPLLFSPMTDCSRQVWQYNTNWMLSVHRWECLVMQTVYLTQILTMFNCYALNYISYDCYTILHFAWCYCYFKEWRVYYNEQCFKGGESEKVEGAFE